MPRAFRELSRDTSTVITLVQGLVAHPPCGFGELIERMREQGFLPVFEGKHIDQFLLGPKPVRMWMLIEQLQRKYGRRYPSKPLLVFRETASNTNERTCMASVLPAYSVATNKLYAVSLEHVSPTSACTVLNSLVYDYLLCFRVSTNVHPTHMRPTAVPDSRIMSRLPGIETQAAWARQLDHVTSNLDLWPQLWAANRAVAEAYGLGPDDFGHILSTLPGFARKRPAFHAYLVERLAEWVEETTTHGEPVHYASRIGSPASVRVADGGKAEHDVDPE